MDNNEQANHRYQLFCKLMDIQYLGHILIQEYNSMPHRYGNTMLYQAESHLLHLIGHHPGITVTMLAEMTRKTPSACSQMVHKLRNKGWIKQTRNTQNNREYNLELTEDGRIIFDAHEKFDEECYKKAVKNLDEFTDKELELFIAIQRKTNESFVHWIEESKRDFVEIPTPMESLQSKED